MRVAEDNILSRSAAYTYTPKADLSDISTISATSTTDDSIDNLKPFIELSYIDPFRYKIKFEYNKELDIYVKHEIDTQNIYKSKQVPSKEEIYLRTVKKGLYELTEKLLLR